MRFSVTTDLVFGHPVDRTSTFQCLAGLNLVGFCLPPPEMANVLPISFQRQCICAVLREIDGGSQYLIGRAGDSGDTDFAPNEAFMVISPVSYDLEWQIAAAPMAPRAATLKMGWGAMKAR